MRLGGLWDSAQHDNPSTCLDISGGGGKCQNWWMCLTRLLICQSSPTPPPHGAVRGPDSTVDPSCTAPICQGGGARSPAPSLGGGGGGGEAEELRDFIHELQTSEKPLESELQRLCWIRSSDTTGEQGVWVGVWALSSFYSSFHVTCCSSAD